MKAAPDKITASLVAFVRTSRSHTWQFREELLYNGNFTQLESSEIGVLLNDSVKSEVKDACFESESRTTWLLLHEAPFTFKTNVDFCHKLIIISCRRTKLDRIRLWVQR